MAVQTNGDVANKVRGIAAERRKTQADLASILLVSEMAVSRRLNGITPFSPSELSKLADYLDTSVAAFFSERAA